MLTFEEVQVDPPDEQIKATDDAIRVDKVLGNKNWLEEFKNVSTNVAEKDETLNLTYANEPTC